VITAHQHRIRKENLAEDMTRADLSKEEVSKLRVSDFEFSFAPKENYWEEVSLFVSRHEWLGKMSLNPTHLFTATYRGILAGVVVLDMPAPFSKLLGENTRKLERLISRGASISWSPKNLGSSLIMYSVRWMAKNTDYRLFTAYSDAKAGELGTIYQACNFSFLGRKFGTQEEYKIGDKWVSDRYFRTRSAYKRYAKELGILWKSHWQEANKILWDKIPKDVEISLRNLGKEKQRKAKSRKVPKKYKYALVLGANKAETKKLRKQFLERNKVYPYPNRELRGK